MRSSTITSVYDANGLLIERRVEYGDDAQQTNYTYDPLNQLVVTPVTDATTQMFYYYNALGNLIHNPNQPEIHPTRTTNYDHAGQRMFALPEAPTPVEQHLHMNGVRHGMELVD